MNEKKFFSTRNITYLAVLTALVVGFQVFASFVPIGNVSICLVLVPIVLGGMLLGVWAGAFLGLIFGIVVILTSLTNPLVLVVLAEHPVFFVFSCLIRGVAAGAIPALIFKLIAKKNNYVATFVAALSAPIINTGIFILSMLCISGTFMPIMTEDPSFAGASPIYIILIGMVGINFFIEFAINIILSPAIYTVSKVVQKRRNAVQEDL